MCLAQVFCQCYVVNSPAVVVASAVVKDQRSPGKEHIGEHGDVDNVAVVHWADQLQLIGSAIIKFELQGCALVVGVRDVEAEGIVIAIDDIPEH